MRYFFWNIRGCGHGGRRTQLREYMSKEHIDFVALQETIKADFSFRDLLAYDPLQRFDWFWIPSVGLSGGQLMGCNKDVCEVILWEGGTFYIAATIRHRVSQASWVIASVYGPADHARSAIFLDEITAMVGAKQSSNLPVVVGGDFNLIRSGRTKATTILTGLGCPCSIMPLRTLPFGRSRVLGPDTLGLTSNVSQSDVSWTVSFALVTGRRCFLSVL